jgi:hypothetical protein
MAVPEAQQLLSDLQTQISRVSESSGEVRPPEVSVDGYLDKEAFHAFFVQFYPGGAVVNRHVGRLFTQLVRVATYYDGVPFVAICKVCGLHGKDTCTMTRSTHMGSVSSMKLEVASLKEHQSKFLDEHIRNAGKLIKQDFRTLLSYL